jgi:hypothetical protein
MALFDRRDTLEVLGDLLDMERRAILAGDIPAFGRMFAEKERLMKAVRAQAIDIASLAGLREKSARNNLMLQAAANGIRSARQRITQKAVGATLRTYDQSGRKTNLSDTTSSMERRA